ncbi:MAG TPA: hypothetical protein VFO38_00755 [Candidatus Saccharimonadales bacterium]|nr:hypothetical protein [Candidatus Saccharimonadales bacterium]
MLVYFIASRKDIVKRIEGLRRLVKVIHEEGHTLALDWMEPIYANEVKYGTNGVDWPVLYKDSIEAITRADVVVAETSIQSYGVGYQTAVAIQLKKPTLLLYSETADLSAFVSGIPQGSATFKTYTDKNIDKIIRDFLQENDIKAKDMRFNFFIDRPIYNYLRWAAFKTGKTKAEILRELVSKEIEKSNDITQL